MRNVLYWTIGLQLVANTLPEAPPSIVQLADKIVNDFEQHSHYSIIEKDYESLKDDIKSKTENAAECLQKSTQHLDRLFTKRVEALKKLVQSAEASASAFNEFTRENLDTDDELCTAYMRRMNESDVHFVSNAVQNQLSSGTHITVESYQCDPLVMRDYDWTGSNYIEETMKKNKLESEEMGHQYIGTYSGLTRMFPKRHWKIEPSLITIDLFDPRFRPWFVNSESVPKDIVFLIDYSGSVKGPTMHLIKITMMYILSVLNPNDYFFGVYFNSVFNPIVGCKNMTFLPATTSNKKVFFEELGSLEEKDQAHFAMPLKFSLDLLAGNLQSNHSIFSNHRSGGHKLLIIFTDGVDEWPHHILNEEFRMNDNELIRIFGFSMGYGTNQLPLQKFMACKSRGGYSVVDSIMDVKPQSRHFLDVLSNVRGEELYNTKVEARQPSWSHLYMEAQGLGPTITLSMPILALNKSVWGSQSIAGIAGIDISIKELTDGLPLMNEQMYAFLVDNNGIVVYHPKLKIPKTEVHCVRRSACYDATQVKMKAGSGLRVQYGFSDERVYRLVGLIDSIPTIDMYDLEGDLTPIRDLRRRIITKTCHEEPILHNDTEYHCSHIKQSPYTLVIVSKRETSSLYSEKTVKDIPIVKNKLVTFMFPRRDVCQWKLDNYGFMDRYAAWTSLSANEGCLNDDMNLARGLAKGMTNWALSWPHSDTDQPCFNISAPTNATLEYYINSFVYNRAKISAFYPSCSIENMKSVNRKFAEEISTINEKDELIQFSVRDGRLLIYRSISDHDNNRLAIIGTQWRYNYFDEYFQNFTKTHPDWTLCKKQECSLITRNGHVIASSSTRMVGHLTQFDPQLFESLVKGNLVSSSSWVDVQAECMAKRTAPWSSSAVSTSIRNIIKYGFNFLLKFVKISFWKNLLEAVVLYSDAQPTMSGKTCTFQRIKPFERCYVKHFHYRMTLNITKQIQMIGMSVCTRYARLYPVPNTTLSLIIADRACNHYKPRKLYESEPRRLEKCDVVHSYSRRIPDILSDWVIDKKNKYVECATDGSNLLSLYISIVVFGVLLLVVV